MAELELNSFGTHTNARDGLMVQTILQFEWLTLLSVLALLGKLTKKLLIVICPLIL